MPRRTLAAVAVALAACAPIPVTDREAETAALAKQIGVPPGAVRFVSRCQFTVVPKGVASGPPAAGVCMFADGALHVRVIDATTGKSEPYGTFRRAEVESVSLYVGILNQVQVRVPGYVLMMIMRPDGGIGFNEAAARELFELLKGAGYTVVAATGGIDFSAGGGGAMVPIFIPKR